MGVIQQDNDENSKSLKTKEVLIKFETSEQAKEFISWLSNSGEQEYFAQEEYVDDNTTICNKFNYDYENNIINGERV
tara:strand:+ start:28755 stop:28985 length:231 start_codon:yes stop_codon:yes gene_type:complete